MWTLLEQRLSRGVQPWGACFMSALWFDQRRHHVLAEQQLVCEKINEEKHNNLSQVRIFVTPLQFAAFESDAASRGTNGCFCCCAGLFYVRCIAHTCVTDEYCSVNWSLARAGVLIKCWRQICCKQLLYKSWVGWFQRGIVTTVKTPSVRKDKKILMCFRKEAFIIWRAQKKEVPGEATTRKQPPIGRRLDSGLYDAIKASH